MNQIHRHFISRMRILSTILSTALVTPLVAQSPASKSNVPVHSPVHHSAPAVSVDTGSTFVPLTSKEGTLHGQLSTLLKAEAARARANGRTVFVNIGAPWCGPCVVLEEMLTDKRMVDAFLGAELVHLDVDEWTDELDPLNFTPGSLPAIFAVDENGKATSEVLRDTLGIADGIEVAAPRIKRFVQTHLWKSDTLKPQLHKD